MAHFLRTPPRDCLVRLISEVLYFLVFSVEISFWLYAVRNYATGLLLKPCKLRLTLKQSFSQILLYVDGMFYMCLCVCICMCVIHVFVCTCISLSHTAVVIAKLNNSYTPAMM